MAFQYYQAGNLEHASHLCREILRKQPNIAGAYYNLGVVFQEKDQLDEAISSYRKAIHLNPAYADACH